MLVLLMDETLWSLMTEEKDIMCNVFARPTSLLPPQLLAADAQLTSPPPTPTLSDSAQKQPLLFIQLDAHFIPLTSYLLSVTLAPKTKNNPKTPLIGPPCCCGDP